MSSATIAAATLVLVLDSPLQSWGHASQFQHRTTGVHPTKSGVLGLIAAAMGIDKHAPDEAERLAPLAALNFTSLRLPRPHPWRSETSLPLLRLEDYHTVGGGYDEDDPWERLSIPRKAERGGVFGTVVTHRSYLQQARFIVFLEGERATLDRVAAALSDPVWGVWLGRKCCIPAVPVLPHITETRTAALAWMLERLRAARPDATEAEFPGERTATSTAEAQTFLSDQPLGYGPRVYAHRGVSQHQPESHVGDA